jgi:hypothetical protein
MKPAARKIRNHRGRKLTPSALSTIENCFKQGLTVAATAKIAEINVGTVSAVKLALQYLGRL